MLYLGDLKNLSFIFTASQTSQRSVYGRNRNKNHASKVWNEIRERRKLMATYEVDHIDEYNKLNPDKRKPYMLLALMKQRCYKMKKSV